LITSYKGNTNICKNIKEICIRKPRTKRKAIKNIQLVGKIVDIMMGKPIV